MNIIDYGWSMILLQMFVSTMVVIGAMGSTAFNTDDSLYEQQVQFADFNNTVSGFNKTTEELQELSKRPDAGAISELESYLAIGSTVGNLGDFLRATTVTYFKLGSKLIEHGGFFGMIGGLIWYFLITITFASIGGFIINKIRR